MQPEITLNKHTLCSSVVEQGGVVFFSEAGRVNFRWTPGAQGDQKTKIVNNIKAGHEYIRFLQTKISTKFMTIVSDLFLEYSSVTLFCIGSKL